MDWPTLLDQRVCFTLSLALQSSSFLVDIDVEFVICNFCDFIVIGFDVPEDGEKIPSVCDERIAIPICANFNSLGFSF